MLGNPREAKYRRLLAMRKHQHLVPVSILVVILALAVPGFVSASGPDDADPTIPVCSNMESAQIPGAVTGSACRVPVTSLERAGDEMLESIYRSGWTHYYTSESDSDLVEDQIKVTAFLYWWVNNHWSLDDSCEDPRTWASHAACRTYGGGSLNRQDGYHYFHKAGYQDDNFSTQYMWSS
jgi:hypothetical protein